MSDPSAPAIAWPAARPTGISPIQHPAWEEARNAILDLAAAGPVTAVVVGESGTGKTWLLRELASALGDHGFPTMMLMQGNLPMLLSSGAALLVDNASLMDGPTRAQMSAQQHGVVVLAADEWVADALDPASPTPVIIRLRPLQPSEIAEFAAEWLDRAGLSDSMIGPGMLSRLASSSGGRVGAIVQLLGESITAWQTSPIIAPPEPRPEARPELRPEAQPEAHPTAISAVPAEQSIVSPAPLTPSSRRNLYRPLLAGSAIAAMIVLGWALMPLTPPATIAQQASPPPVLADASAAAKAPLPPLREADTAQPAQSADAAPAAAPSALPPLHDADTPGPALATAANPAPPNMPAPPLAATPAPELDAANVAAETEIPAAYPTIGAAPPPPVVAPANPTLVATLDDPATIKATFLPRPSNRSGGPGLVLIAQRGDTLESLYGDVYRDRSAPPFATVLAANPGRFRPGAIVVFPEPPGGWNHVQR